MRKMSRQREAIELQEVPPTKDTILVLVKACPTPNWRSYVSGHVPHYLLKWELKESLPHIHHSPYHFNFHSMIHNLHINIYFQKLIN